MRCIFTNRYSAKQYTFSKEMLQEPTILFSSNHLLVVNKPCGWHSVPNENSSKPKCLLHKLKQNGMGGGSNQQFLLPMHRIDQPCTGIMLFAKTSKAASRIGKAWKERRVQKEYLCIVSGSLNGMKEKSLFVNSLIRSDINSKFLIERNFPTKQTQIKLQSSGNKTPYSYSIKGVLQDQKRNKASKGSRSVVFSTFQVKSGLGGKESRPEGRVCELEWKHLCTLSDRNRKNDGGFQVSGNDKRLHLISVRTDSGARHQVRAMLSQITCSPIVGDLRYGFPQPLKDKSVCLHARSLMLPTVKLGDISLSNNFQMALPQLSFAAPIPSTWFDLFGLKDKDVREMEKWNM
mmetsp:Transcript_18025/g.18252  ORF Transcript_18025/g.18252 Transcript_18025/m.18252 type:complete len:347 (-) Transcript_18025:355-1395(-)